jgi:hypothetical protein
MNNLKLLVNSKFNKVIKISCLINNYKNDNLFHNYYRLKHGFKKGKETYNGSFHCGVTSYVLGNLLKKEGIKVKMYLQESGYGKYKEDHVFLKYNNIVIDTTYKQFFTNNISNGTTNYHYYLYEILPPFFVGTIDELKQLYFILETKSLNQLKYQTFDESILEKWKGKIDITTKLNLTNKIYNKERVLKYF